ncbi:MAG: hypothetical protein HYV09_01055 [Deltaproteobacteria bacterium]|nr:hypothetical protein [Deltaproteobacteria bacterium]
MRRFLRENSLGLVLLGLFLATLAGNALAGWHVDSEERRLHQQAPIAFASYLTSSHFLESVAENWESEFLQMAAYVWLTAWLRQKGSAESKPLGPDEREEMELRPHPWAPRVVFRGGLLLKLYSSSLSIALAALFVVSFMLHAVSGAAKHNEEMRLHGGEGLSVLGYVRTAQFWFESMQNWQSEFLAVLAIVLLSIGLRQRGSPESKPVNAPHAVTGEEV